MSQEIEQVKTGRHRFLRGALLTPVRRKLGTSVLALALLLSACGTETPTVTPVPPATPEATATVAAPAAPEATATTAAPAASEATATGAPAAGGDQVVNMLCTDSNNRRQPLIADFTKATGIKVNQVQVQYNELLDKINTTTQGGGDTDVIEMDTIWTPQFASAGWVEDISDRVSDSIKKDIPESSLGAVRYQGK